MDRRIFSTAFALTLLSAFSARADSQKTDKKIPVTTTFSILADFARQVGGERVDVVSLVAPDSDVHSYSPSPADGRRLAAARLIVENGLGLEGWIGRLIETSSEAAKIIIAAQAVIPLKKDGVVDPHAWQDVANAKIYVGAIRDGLIAVDPVGADYYRARSDAYFKALDDLDRDIRATIAQIPPERRQVVSTHDAFGYFQKAYGITFISPAGVSSESDVSARDIARIVKQIRETHIPAVFFETISDPRISAQIAHESGAKIGGALYSDALSPPDGPAATYIAMMRQNGKELFDALKSP